MRIKFIFADGRRADHIVPYGRDQIPPHLVLRERAQIAPRPGQSAEGVEYLFATMWSGDGCMRAMEKTHKTCVFWENGTMTEQGE